MGAPGEAFLCESGHLYGWIDDDMYWDYDEVHGHHVPEKKTGTLWELSERYSKDGCPCGRRLGVKLCHYGDINDCRTPEEGYFNPAGEDVITRRARIPDAIDARGCPIEAYRQVKHTLETYRLLPPGEYPEYIREKFIHQFGG